MKKTLKMWLTAFLVGLVASPSAVFAAASGHYTDLLPNPTSAPNIVQGALIYNGYDWSIAPLAPAQTYGDSLSRTEMTVYQSSSPSVWGGNSAQGASTFTALSGQGIVGSTTFPASWVATGRTIRVTTAGQYSTSTGTWTWDLLLGTTSIMSTGAVTTVGSQTDKFFKAQALVTLGTTGNGGTANGTFDISVASGPVPFTLVSFSTMTGNAVSVDLTSQLTVRPRITWGSPATGNRIQFTNITVEFLN